jgi:DnaJ-class molecular chaperone
MRRFLCARCAGLGRLVCGFCRLPDCEMACPDCQGTGTTPEYRALEVAA